MKNINEAVKNFDIYSELMDERRYADAYCFLNFQLLDYQKSDMNEFIHLMSEEVRKSVVEDKNNG